MDRIKITGGGPLEGVIPISGAKNAALPLMIASLLTRDTLTLSNMPLLADVTQLERILGNHGVDFAISGKRSGQSESAGRTVHFTARDIVDTTAPYDLVSRMRASFWVIAPLLARMGEAKVSRSQSTTVSRWFVMPMVSGLAPGLASSAWRVAASVACQICSGSCSTHPAFGKCCGNSF